MMKNKVVLLLMSCIIGLEVFASSFYRTPSFQVPSFVKLDDFTTRFDAQIRSGQASQAYDGQEKIVALFDSEGPFNITQIIPYDPSIAGGVTTSGVLNSAAPTLTGAGLTYVTNAYAIQQSSKRISKTSSPFSFGGKFKETDFNFDLQQNLKLGFFVGMMLPIRSLSLTDISYSTTIPYDEGRYTSLQNLIANDLDPMLQQQRIAPLKTPFNRAGVSDLCMYLGWQDKNETESDFIKYISGAVRGTFSIPTGAVRDLDRVFALPMGANGHYGMHARGNIELGLFKYLAAGASLATSVYLRQNIARRLKTDATQNGWLLLDKANVLEDLGHLWEGTAFVKAYAKYGFVLFGFSLNQQERSSLKVEAADNVSGLFKHEIINSDQRLTGWNYQTIHLLLRADAAAMTRLPAAPLIELSYDFPLAGKHVFNAPMFGARAGLTVAWEF